MTDIGLILTLIQHNQKQDRSEKEDSVSTPTGKSLQTRWSTPSGSETRSSPCLPTVLETEQEKAQASSSKPLAPQHSLDSARFLPILLSI